MLGWQVPNLREPLPLAAITAILVFTLDDQQGSLTVGFWCSVEIVAGVAVGLGLAVIPFPGESRQNQLPDVGQPGRPGFLVSRSCHPPDAATLNARAGRIGLRLADLPRDGK